MPAPANLTGQTFGRLTALRPERTPGGRYGWRCRCTCGREVVVETTHLRKTVRQCRACGQGEAGRAAAARNNAPVERTCAVCGRPCTGRRMKSAYCSKRCRNRASNGRPSLPAPRPCEVCGRMIQEPRAGQRWCGERCYKVGQTVDETARRDGPADVQVAAVAAELARRLTDDGPRPDHP